MRVKYTRHRIFGNRICGQIANVVNFVVVQTEAMYSKVVILLGHTVNRLYGQFLLDKTVDHIPGIQCSGHNDFTLWGRFGSHEWMRGFLFCSANKAVELICVFHFSSDLPAAAHGDLSSLNDSDWIRELQCELTLVFVKNWNFRVLKWNVNKSQVRRLV